VNGRPLSSVLCGEHKDLPENAERALRSVKRDTDIDIMVGRMGEETSTPKSKKCHMRTTPVLSRSSSIASPSDLHEFYMEAHEPTHLSIELTALNTST